MGDAAPAMTRRTYTISHLLLSLAVAVVLGAALVPGVDAEVVSVPATTSIKKRVEHFTSSCTKAGGTTTTVKKPGGTTVTCTGGTNDGLTCTYTKKVSRCHTTLTNPPQAPLQDVATPPTGGIEEPTSGATPGGAGGIDPTGGYEDPTGGANPGGGGGTDPGWGAEQPSDGSGIILTAYDSGQHDKAKHDGNRKNRGRDGKRAKK
jgi:hypothetical protein